MVLAGADERWLTEKEMRGMIGKSHIRVKVNVHMRSYISYINICTIKGGEKNKEGSLEQFR